MMTAMRHALVAVLAVSTLVLPSVAHGTSCASPEMFREYSPSRRFEVIFEPREGQRPRLTSWEWRNDRRVRACRRSMMNIRAPWDLHVTDSGHVVTFDDWCRAGYEHALVVYSPTCEIVRDVNLEQLLSVEDIGRTDRTHSSRNWRYYHEPTSVTQSTVSFTSSWGMTATVAAHDGSISWSGPPFKNLARLVRGDLGSLVRAVLTQGDGPTFRACDWYNNQVSCTRIDNQEPKVFFTARSPRASLRGRLEPILKLQHLIRTFPPCGTHCKERLEIELTFREGDQRYIYKIRGDAGGPPEENASLRTLFAAFGFRTSEQQ
jgi:hypothetical protein